jgi:hypothetical protein
VVTPTRLAARRRALQVALAVVWLVDAALQFQPSMFSASFVTSALEPAASGTPGLVARPMLWADHLMVHHIAWYNALFALIQLLIGLGLLWRRTVRLARGTSIVWGLAVWWVAEGFGGVFSGASPLSGEPGAVVLYVLVAVFVWPTPRREGASVVAASAGGRAGAALGVVVWGTWAVYFVLPHNRTPQGLSHVVAGVAAGEPAWVRAMDHGLASLLAGRGLAVSLVLALACVAVALAGLVAVPSLVRAALVVALVLAAGIWLTQDFGGVFTAQGTDVNSGPLVALLAWTYWPLAPRTPRTPRPTR